MTLNPPMRQALVRELTEALDRHIGLMELRVVQLAAMCAAVMERDDQRLSRLLADVEITHGEQQAADDRLRALRKAIAGTLGCGLEDVRLSRFMDELNEEERFALEFRRQQVILLMDKLRRQHLQTVRLVGEFSRANKRLLAALLGQGDGAPQYGADGRSQFRGDLGLVDAEM